jgi:hypothetical protein
MELGARETPQKRTDTERTRSRQPSSGHAIRIRIPPCGQQFLRVEPRRSSRSRSFAPSSMRPQFLTAGAKAAGSPFVRTTPGDVLAYCTKRALLPRHVRSPDRQGDRRRRRHTPRRHADREPIYIRFQYRDPAALSVSSWAARTYSQLPIAASRTGQRSRGALSGGLGSLSCGASAARGRATPDEVARVWKNVLTSGPFVSTRA